MHKHLIAFVCVAALGGGSVAVLAQSGAPVGAGQTDPELAAASGDRDDCGARRSGRGGHGGRGRGPDLERLAVILDLSDEQIVALEAIQEERRAQRQAMREAMQARMAQVLDEDQQARLEALHEMRGGRRGHGRGKRQGDGASG